MKSDVFYGPEVELWLKQAATYHVIEWFWRWQMPFEGEVTIEWLRELTDTTSFAWPTDTHPNHAFVNVMFDAVDWSEVFRSVTTSPLIRPTPPANTPTNWLTNVSSEAYLKWFQTYLFTPAQQEVIINGKIDTGADLLRDISENFYYAWPPQEHHNYWFVDYFHSRVVWGWVLWSLRAHLIEEMSKDA